MKTNIFALFVIVGSSFAVFAAEDTIWDGSESYDWTDPANWSNGVPINSDFGSDAYFGTGTPGTITNIPDQSIRSINFTTAGWTLDGSFNRFKDLSSFGAGINTITGDLNEQVGGATYTIGAGNTLFIGDYLRIYDEDVTLDGGGILSAANLQSSDFGSPEFRLDDITLRVRRATPFATSNHQGEIHLRTQTSLLQLDTMDVASVEALFGDNTGGIFDDLGGTSRLQASYNSGSGFTEVSLIPEPSSVALLMISGLTALCVIRKRRS